MRWTYGRPSGRMAKTNPDVLVWTASHPRGLMALLASEIDERKVQ
jgi:hypothetical protein